MRTLTPWLKFGGVEICNPRRTLAYLRLGLHQDSRLYAFPADSERDCSALPSGPFLSPAADGAPWYLAARPESVEFMGLLLTAIDVSEPLARSVNPRGGDGQSIGVLKQRGRTVSCSGVMYARTQRGMDWGRRWLAEKLRGSDVDDPCFLDDLEILPACPPDGSQNYFRTLKRSGVLDAVFTLPIEDIPGGLIQEVRFQLASEIPWLYAPGENYRTDSVITAGTTTCSLLDNSSWIGDATAKLVIEAGTGAAVSGLRVTGLLSAVCSPLDAAEASWKASDFVEGSQQLNDGSGNSHHAQLGSTTGVDTTDPLFLGLESDGRQYAYFPGIAGNDVSTPDHNTLDFERNIDFRAEIAPDDWTPAAIQAIPSKWVAAGNQRSYRLLLLTTGVIRFSWSEDGTTEETADSTVATGFTNGERHWIRVRTEGAIAGGSGGSPNTVRFETSSDGVTWTQLGVDVSVAGMGSFFNSSSAVTVGSSDGGSPFAGKVWQVDLRSTVGGQLLIDFTDRVRVIEPFVSWVSGPFTITINRFATGRKTTIVDRDLFLLGTDDYFEVPDHANLDFAAADSYTIVAAYRVYGTTTGQVILAKKANLTTAAGYALARGATANLAQFFVADGAADDDDAISVAMSEGVATAIAGRNSNALDQVEAFKNGVASGTPTTDSTTATFANAEVLRIGRLSGAGAAQADMEFFGAAIFRSALTATDILNAGNELLGTPSTQTYQVDFDVDTMQPGETLTIDGTERTVELRNSAGDLVAGLDAVDPATGLFTWIDLHTGETMCVCVDAVNATVNGDTTMTLDLYEREL